ncbi:MAG: DUF427 domain-containing protein [Gammaproteobacteria bacterium]
MWEFDGRNRPAFALPPAAGQESVWDYPRPPRLKPDTRRVEVWHGTQRIADTTRAWRVLETASPPTFYLPGDDVTMALLRSISDSSFCEWKGAATYFALADGGAPGQTVAWSYPRPTAAFAGIAGFLSFYPGRLQCRVAGEIVRPQPGGFYGGWVTDEILGPFKGEPGTGHW